MPEAVPILDKMPHSARRRLSAEEHTLTSQEATERANDYVLTTVLFATVFFASISSELRGVADRWAILSIAMIGLLAGGVILLAFPRAPTA